MKSMHVPQSLKLAVLAVLGGAGTWYALNDIAPAVSTGDHRVASEKRMDDSHENFTDPVAAVPEDNAAEVSGALEDVLASRVLFASPVAVQGNALEVKSAAAKRAILMGERLLGRIASLDPASFSPVTEAQEGEAVTFPLFDRMLTGVVEVAVNEENGWRRIGGPLRNGEDGWFTFGYNGTDIAGMVRMPSQGLAYRITKQEAGGYRIVEQPLNDLMCFSMPKGVSMLDRPSRKRTPAAAAKVKTPILNSRPTATATILIDFDGAKTNDPEWGRVDAAPSPLTPAQRQDVWRRVSEDFAPFNLNITTDQKIYNQAVPGNRMRCIVTPTNFTGAGGIAFLTSFDNSGKLFSNRIPCWCFNGGVKAGADTVSHEIGHTLGLYHDGDFIRDGEYYSGHGTGPTSWGPIMGAPFNRTLTQWSKGEYNGANRFEDDLMIIANDNNGFGYAQDLVGDTPATSSPLMINNGIVEQFGTIERIRDAEVYSFFSQVGGSVLVSASGTGSSVGNLDVHLDLLNSFGVVVASNEFDRSLGAGLAAVAGPGVNYIRVRGTGEGDVKATGYSRYGSRGGFLLTGRVP